MNKLFDTEMKPPEWLEMEKMAHTLAYDGLIMGDTMSGKPLPPQRINMDKTLRTHLDNIRSKNKALQNEAYTYLLEATGQPVTWAYEAWDEIVAGLINKDNRVRAITSQILCHLAQSDPDKRILADFDKLLTVTKDERFVTARHCLQTLWKIGTIGPEQQKMVVAGLEQRFNKCIAEKNCTLIRYDIIQGLRNLYDAVPDESIKEKALALIETEEDMKYRKKYATIWRNT